MQLSNPLFLRFVAFFFTSRRHAPAVFPRAGRVKQKVELRVLRLLDSRFLTERNRLFFLIERF
jgi:hypothetical protein